MNQETASHRIHPDFQRLFFRKEGKVLLGPKKRNLWVLVVIMFVTFTAIGFANGSLVYLRKKMANPFINWVNIEVPYGKNDQIRSIEAELNRPEMQQAFGYGKITGSTGESLPIYSLRRKGAKIARGRTIPHDSPLIGKIMESYLAGRQTGFAGEYDLGLIVTEDFLKRFGYDKHAKFVLLSFSTEVPDSIAESLRLAQEEEVLTPLPLAAVVKELPDLRDFVCTPYFEGNYAHSLQGNPFHPDNLKNEIHFLLESEDKAYEMKTALESAFPDLNETFSGLTPFALAPEMIPDLTYDTLWRVGINFIDDIHRKEMDQVLVWLEQLPALQPLLGTYQRVYSYQVSSSYHPFNYDFLSVNFHKLDKVRAFRDTLLALSDIEIDIAQVDAKENFNYVTKLTRITSFVLIGLSVLSICLFVSHIFQRHLERVSRNLGTFKAFGIDDRSLIRIYLNMSGVFLLIALSLSLLLSSIFGYLGGIRILLFSLTLQLESGEIYYKLLDTFTYLAVFLVVFLGIWVLSRTARSILRHPPGDLVNGRILEDVW